MITILGKMIGFCHLDAKLKHDWARKESIKIIDVHVIITKFCLLQMRIIIMRSLMDHG